MTFSDLEWLNSPYFALVSPNPIALQADYFTVVEDRPIISVNMSPSFSLPLLDFWPKLTHPSARSFCDS